jgi:cytochrome c-type biogenesis protein CcmH
MKRLVPLLVAIVIALASAMPAFAVDPDEMLANPVLEKRAREISSQLRCLVCQNESIDVSSADFARDLRGLVRRRLKQGETNQQVIDYIVSRYGEFVLLRPRFETKTVLLWGTPVIVLVCGAAAMILYARGRSRRPTGTGLSADEEAQLQAMLNKENT